MKTVELHQAFVWTCDECGRENFARCVTLTSEQVRHMVSQATRDEVESQRQAMIEQGREELGEMDVEAAGSWLVAPESVTCQHCGETFGVEGAE